MTPEQHAASLIEYFRKHYAGVASERDEIAADKSLRSVSKMTDMERQETIDAITKGEIQ